MFGTVSVLILAGIGSDLILLTRSPRSCTCAAKDRLGSSEDNGSDSVASLRKDSGVSVVRTWLPIVPSVSIVDDTARDDRTAVRTPWSCLTQEVGSLSTVMVAVSTSGTVCVDEFVKIYDRCE